MISYEPLWQTMKRHGATTYTLQAKAGISSSTIRRMQANESVSTNTLDTLCKFFNCELDDIVKFQPDEKQHGEMVIAVSPCFFDPWHTKQRNFGNLLQDLYSLAPPVGDKYSILKGGLAFRLLNVPPEINAKIKLQNWNTRFTIKSAQTARSNLGAKVQHPL